MVEVIFTIMSDEKMLGQLQKKLKNVVKDGKLSEGLISTNFLERHYRPVQRNKGRTRREFCVDAQIAGF